MEVKRHTDKQEFEREHKTWKGRSVLNVCIIYIHNAQSLNKWLTFIFLKVFHCTSRRLYSTILAVIVSSSLFFCLFCSFSGCFDIHCILISKVKKKKVKMKKILKVPNLRSITCTLIQSKRKCQSQSSRSTLKWVRKNELNFVRLRLVWK